MTELTPDDIGDELDEIPFEPVMLDQRTQALLDMEALRCRKQEWQAADHRRRLAEQPGELEAARRHSEADERLRLEAVIPRSDALDLEEVEPDEGEGEQEQVRNRQLASQLEVESRERRVRLIMYDLACSREDALAWWWWENGTGPKPTPVVIAEVVADDPDLDDFPTNDL